MLRPHRIPYLSTVPRALNEPGAIEHGEMLGHCLSGKGQFGRQRGRCDLALREDQLEDTAPRCVGDGLVMARSH